MCTYRRKQLRLKHYNYKQNGLYFITICIQNRECLLGEINDQITVYEAGEMIKEIWENMPLYYNGIHTHEFIVMPNHVHGIIVIGISLSLNLDSYVAEREPLLIMKPQDIGVS